MRITFTFTDERVLTTKTEHKYNSTLVLPDTAYELPDMKLKIMAIADLVATLSNVYVFVSCKEVGIDKHIVRTGTDDLSERWVAGTGLRLTFQYFSAARQRYSRFNIYHFQRKLITPASLGGMDDLNRNTDKGAPIVKELIRRIVELGQGKTGSAEWHFIYYEPRYDDPTILRMLKNLEKKKKKQERDQQKLQEKQQKTMERQQAQRQKREATIRERPAHSGEEPKTGAGRTYGARPGIFDGVQMRSQLEIRFAAELKERRIRYIYEGETLGDVGYLVDFYLPDLGVWVEVKGRFEARDRQVLPQVASVLKQRGQGLFVYTSGTCHKVNPSGFLEIPGRDFWEQLVKG